MELKHAIVEDFAELAARFEGKAGDWRLVIKPLATVISASGRAEHFDLRLDWNGKPLRTWSESGISLLNGEVLTRYMRMVALALGLEEQGLAMELVSQFHLLDADAGLKDYALLTLPCPEHQRRPCSLLACLASGTCRLRFSRETQFLERDYVHVLRGMQL